jgi:chaperonin GroES
MSKRTWVKDIPALEPEPEPSVWTPLGKRVMVKPISENKQDGNVLVTPGGVAMPTSAAKPSIAGVVVAAGRGCQDVAPGDMVMFVSYQGATVKVKTTDYIVLDEGDILCVLRSRTATAPRAPRGKPIRADAVISRPATRRAEAS